MYIWIRVEYVYMCKWFEYDVIKKMTMQIMTSWSKILILSTLLKTELLAKRLESFVFYMGKWAGGHCLHNMTAAM